MTEIFTQSDKNYIERAVEVLANGGVVLHPTETSYGLAASVESEEAVRKIFEIKGRDFNKPMNILVADLEMAQRFGVFSDKALSFAKKYWPGALTLLVPRTLELPKYLNPGEAFVGMRISSDPLCERIVEGLKSPIITTSANVSGNEQLYKVDLSHFFGKENLIDLVIDGGEIPFQLPSTILKIEGEKAEIIRQGEIVIIL